MINEHSLHFRTLLISQQKLYEQNVTPHAPSQFPGSFVPYRPISFTSVVQLVTSLISYEKNEVYGSTKNTPSLLPFNFPQWKLHMKLLYYGLLTYVWASLAPWSLEVHLLEIHLGICALTKIIWSPYLSIMGFNFLILDLCLWSPYLSIMN